MGDQGRHRQRRVCSGSGFPRSTAATAPASLEPLHRASRNSRGPAAAWGSCSPSTPSGSFPIILGGTEEQKRRWLPADRHRQEADRLLSLREVRRLRRGSRCACPPARTGDGYVLNGEKKWTTNGGAADLYTVFASPIRPRDRNASRAFLVEKDDARASRSARWRTSWASAACPVVETVFKDVRVARANLLGGDPGPRLQARHADARQGPSRRRGAGGRPGPGGARVRRSSTPRGASSSAQPISSFQMIQKTAGRHGDEDRGGPAARLRGRARHRRRRCR